MEKVPSQTEKYSFEWFKERAFNSIKKTGDNIWDYSDSLLLYTPGADDEYEEIQKVDTPYHKLITKPEREYLQEISERVVAQLPQEFEYIDLGPGTEHKEQFIFDAAKRPGKHFTYTPVDISEKFLTIAREYAAPQGIEVKPTRASFEELPSKLTNALLPRFVSLGLTYSNYNPAEILTLLKDIAGPNGTAFINAQLRERLDMKALQEIYAKDGYTIAKAKFELIGLSEEDVQETQTTDGIQIWCTLKHSNATLEKMGIIPGAKLLIFQSLRPTHEKLEHDVQTVFPNAQFFDTGKSFVGALLK